MIELHLQTGSKEKACMKKKRKNIKTENVACTTRSVDGELIGLTVYL